MKKKIALISALVLVLAVAVYPSYSYLAHTYAVKKVYKLNVTAEKIYKLNAAAVFEINQTNASGDTAQASGFFISPNGIALTAYHTIDEADTATIYLSDGTELELESVYYTDSSKDIAIIQITNPNNVTFPYLEINATKKVREKDEVFAMGFQPTDWMYGCFYSSGKVLWLGAVTYSKINETEYRRTDNQITMTAEVIPGMSGGPVMNNKNQVIGVISGTESSDRNYAIPLTVIHQTLNELLR